MTVSEPRKSAGRFPSCIAFRQPPALFDKGPASPQPGLLSCFDVTSPTCNAERPHPGDIGRQNKGA